MLSRITVGVARRLRQPMARSVAPSASFSASPSTAADAQSVVYPGNNELPLVSEMKFVMPEDVEKIPVFRMMDENGQMRSGIADPMEAEDGPSKDDVLNYYTTMLRLQALDTVFYDAQRQGRISFYMQNAGEEGLQIGAASALTLDDVIFGQYREAGVLMYRGFSLQQFADQCYSNRDDGGKGRQMPVHYGSAELNWMTISSPLTTQLPQAAGAGYALKMAGQDACAVTFFGEGAASEGDFHAGMNFATTVKAPVIFFCRNNGYAISTPTVDQYGGDAIAGRGVAYGMPTLRVDGTDLWAVREATKAARALAIESGPVLIEAMAYREGHHSTSDDSTRYRSPEEIQEWRSKTNPISRFRAYLTNKGLWDDEKDAAARKAERKAVLTALTAAEAKGPPPVSELFTDVYAEKPWHLEEQEAQLHEHLAKYPKHYEAGH